MSQASQRRRRVISPERLERGITRLLTAPLDLARCGARVWEVESRAGSKRHRDLFSSYLEDLRRVIPEAARIWEALVTEYEKALGDRTKGVMRALVLQPAGPAFDARVVAIVREYWIRCDVLNRELPELERVTPQEFMLQWLIDAKEHLAVEVLAGMPYWPIGLDRDGNWV